MTEEVHYIPVTTRMPRGRDDPGGHEDAWYIIRGGVVILCDRNGKPRLTRKGAQITECVSTGTMARSVAYRLAKANLASSDRSFNRKLEYFNFGKI
jgi:hypothetical protein